MRMRIYADMDDPGLASRSWQRGESSMDELALVYSLLRTPDQIYTDVHSANAGVGLGLVRVPVLNEAARPRVAFRL